VMTCAADELISSSKIFSLSLCGGPHDRGFACRLRCGARGRIGRFAPAYNDLTGDHRICLFRADLSVLPMQKFD
jgi:hypothetical protein